MRVHWWNSVEAPEAFEPFTDERKFGTCQNGCPEYFPENYRWLPVGDIYEGPLHKTYEISPHDKNIFAAYCVNVTVPLDFSLWNYSIHPDVQVTPSRGHVFLDAMRVYCL